MARQKRRYTAQQWAELIREQLACGDPVDVFCARKRIGASTFTKWRRRFQDGWNVPTRETIEKTTSFLEAMSPSCAVLSLVPGDGVRLELPAALGSEKIAELTQAVVNHERR